MAVTRTFSIIKPDATRRNLTGAVTKMLEDAGLRVVASKRIHMTREQAEGRWAMGAKSSESTISGAEWTPPSRAETARLIAS